jgi:hypothetical protein
VKWMRKKRARLVKTSNSHITLPTSMKSKAVDSECLDYLRI